MLTELTSTQKDLMIDVRDEWISKIRKLNFNKEACVDHVNWLYRKAGLETPKLIIVESPLSAQIAANMAKALIENSTHQVWDQVGEQVQNQVWNQVQNQVRKQVGEQVWKQVGEQVWKQVGEQVWKQVQNQVQNQVREQARKSTLMYFPFAWYVNISDYGWCSQLDYFFRIGVLNYEDHPDFARFVSLLDSGVYDMIQLNDLCIVVKLPEFVKRHAVSGKLHCVDGPAVRFGDGYELFFLQGICIDQALFENFKSGSLVLRDVMRVENIEQRYALLRELDKEALLRDGGGLVVSGPTARGNCLYEVRGLVEDRVLKMLRYSCPSTGREYFKFVPDRFVCADEAQAWSHGFTVDEYSQLSNES